MFHAPAIESLIRDHMERRVNAGYHLWGLMTLFLWMKRWKVEAGPLDRGVTSARVSRHYSLIVALIAALIFLGCIVSPPSLMDDVDAVQAQIARNMLQSGDWVTARLDGMAYLEKSPLKYWMIATSFVIFGVHDWAARIPIALSAVLFCWVTSRFGAWAFGRQRGNVRRDHARDVRRVVSLYAHIDSGRGADAGVTIAFWGLLRAIR